MPLSTDSPDIRPTPARRVLVAAYKGGVGKTTLAIHLAAWSAAQGVDTVLADCDLQHAALEWADRGASRNTTRLRVVEGADPLQGVGQSWSSQVSPLVERVVVDTPAGLRPHHLSAYVRRSDVVLVPLQPSTIDTATTRRFVAELLRMPEVAQRGVRIALVANRARARTLSLRHLAGEADTLGAPMVAAIRDAQAYVMAIALGRSVFDIPSPRLDPLREEWLPLLTWLGWRPAERAIDLHANPSTLATT
ncbi:MAG TPA: ParA family protein [Xanthomonadaceae bacterium]|nr:ParA family protein [Xanthomonadaceae bacterium]